VVSFRVPVPGVGRDDPGAPGGDDDAPARVWLVVWPAVIVAVFVAEYPTHVKGHPPLPMLILWTTQWTGLRGAGWAAALVIAVGGSATAAIALTMRAVAGEWPDRRAVPFLVLAPTTIWVATSMDPLFLGVAAWGVALPAVAAARAGAAGPLPPGGSIPLQSSRPVDRGDKRFHSLWITLSPGGVAHAPARGLPLPAAAGVSFALGMLVGAAPAGVLAVDLAGVTRGEVERIWLPYAAWITAAAVHRAPARGLLLAQAVTALLPQALVRSPW
jgi:hypothetical protein